MSKFKMTVFSEIPVHPITLDEVKEVSPIP